jgi:peptidoglycan L-alanyl-D-glutamate endopeptidase CwlK|nr:MAG TPA_asm: L alanyl D glutamate peptidase endolysin [Caudoviricetes sp.]
MCKFSRTSEKRLMYLHPNLQKFFIELLKISPYDFSISQGVRTVEEQNKLYQQGRTTPGKIITNCDGYKIKSKHQVKSDGFGHAGDIAILVDGKVTWEEKYYKEVARVGRVLMQKYNIEWGGDWKKFKDLPHFEYIGE